MTGLPPGDPPPPRDPRREIEFLRHRIAALARGRWTDDHEDLAMEAWVKLDRVLRSEDPRNLDALMTRIARFTWIDWTRRRRGDPGFVDIDGPGIDPPAEPGEHGVDAEMLALVRFCVLEYFEAHRAAECVEVARHFFAGRNWFKAAELLGLRRDALAKRWERCRRRVVEAFRADLPGPLHDIAHRLEEVLA